MLGRPAIRFTGILLSLLAIFLGVSIQAHAASHSQPAGTGSHRMVRCLSVPLLSRGLAPNADQLSDDTAHQSDCEIPPQTPPLRLVSTISIPGTPASRWCYDTAFIDKNTYYLADTERAGIDVVHDGQQPTYQGIIGKGQFTGIGGCQSGNYGTDGPNGVVVAHGQIFAADGNSSVRVYTTTGTFLTSISTHGHLRTDEITYDAHDELVIVANSSERDFSPQAAPFLSFISTKQGKTYDQVVKTIPFPAASALEQPMWNPADGKVYLAVPSSTQNPTGEVDVIDPKTLHVTSIPTPNCEDAGFAFANREVAAVGCAAGEQIVLNVHTHHIIHVPVASVDIVAADEHLLFFASYGNETHAPQLAVTNLQGQLLQRIPSSSRDQRIAIVSLSLRIHSYLFIQFGTKYTV